MAHPNLNVGMRPSALADRLGACVWSLRTLAVKAIPLQAWTGL